MCAHSARHIQLYSIRVTECLQSSAVKQIYEEKLGSRLIPLPLMMAREKALRKTPNVIGPNCILYNERFSRRKRPQE